MLPHWRWPAGCVGGLEVQFRVLYDEVSGELTYLLADEEAREAVLVDPHGRNLPVLQAMLDERELLLRWVLRTHDHDALMPGEFARLGQLKSPIVQGRAVTGAQRPADATQLHFGHEQVRVIETPGHTPYCLSFAWRDRVFCGGLLTVDACPRQPHPAQSEALWDSVTQRIFIMPDETLLFAGHERRARAVSTVLEQRRWNPRFAGLTRDEFLTQMAALQRSGTRSEVGATA